MPGPKELILILIIVVIFFGVGKLPKIMGDFGKGIKNFKKGLNEEDNVKEIDSESDIESKKNTDDS